MKNYFSSVGVQRHDAFICIGHITSYLDRYVCPILFIHIYTSINRYIYMWIHTPKLEIYLYQFPVWGSSVAIHLFESKKPRGWSDRKTENHKRPADDRTDGRTDILYCHSEGLNPWPTAACAACNYRICEWTFIVNLKPIFKKEFRYNLCFKKILVYFTVVYLKKNYLL